MKNIFLYFNKFLILLLLISCSTSNIIKTDTAANENLSSEDVQEIKDLNEFITFYYLEPKPEYSGIALKKYLYSEQFLLSDDNIIDWPIVYFFAKIAKLEPSILQEYKLIFLNLKLTKQRLFLLNVFVICGNDDIYNFLSGIITEPEYTDITEAINNILTNGFATDYIPILADVTSLTDLDILWSDFFVTGSTASINSIINVVNWDDMTRILIEQYISGNNSQPNKNNLIVILNNFFDIKIDTDTNIILNNTDIDIKLAMYLSNNNDDSTGFRQVDEIIRISNDDLLYLSIKGAAYWSLQSNLIQHKKVFEICKNNIDAFGTKTTISILNILLYYYSNTEEPEYTFSTLERICKLDNYDEKSIFTLGKLYILKNNINSVLTQLNRLNEINSKYFRSLNFEYFFMIYKALNINDTISLSDTAQINDVKNKINSSIIAETFSSRAFLNYYTDIEQSRIVWNMDYNNPDRFEVEQTIYLELESLYDIWITIQDDHYVNQGFWFKSPGGEIDLWRVKTNYFLKVNNWVELIIANFNILEFNTTVNEEFIIITFTPDSVNVFMQSWCLDSFNNYIEVWLDRKTYVINKSILTCNNFDDNGNEVSIEYIQLFQDYNLDFGILIPDVLFDFEN